MKKKLATIITSIVITLVLVATLCGCSTFGKIQKAFENEGYTQSENAEKYQDQFMKYLNAESDEEVEQICTVHIFTKDYVKVAIIFEFKSTDELNEQIEKSDALKGAIKDAQNSDYVNGNCILVPIALPEVVEIFKNA